jgi:predicted phage terminase large subunit-like protein
VSEPRVEFRPQPGPQEQFLSSPADIAIYGGAAFGGKTFGLLLEPLRHTHNGKFGAVIFRREQAQVTNEGGLWDTAIGIYPSFGAVPRTHPRLQFRFPGGARVNFAGLQTESDVLDWQGGQIALMCFDELTHFTRGQFFYMLSRNRSMSGVRPYIRATTNPDADSWVAEFIAWWIDQDTGLPIPERSGVVRWFVRVNDTIMWADSAAELAEKYATPLEDAKSVTFISAKATDNKIGLEKDPGYMANLKALSHVERARLLDGNWKVRPAAGLYFKRSEVEIIQRLPDDIVAFGRAWDLAASEPSEANPTPDWTAGVKVGRRENGTFVVCDVARDRIRSGKVRELVKRVAAADGEDTRIRLPQDPGQAGKDQAESYVCDLAGYRVDAVRVTGDKITRAEPVSSQWQHGNFQVLAAPWTEAFLAELEAFPQSKFDDQVDALADAFDIVKNPHAGEIAVGAPRVFGGHLDEMALAAA